MRGMLRAFASSTISGPMPRNSNELVKELRSLSSGIVKLSRETLTFATDLTESSLKIQRCRLCRELRISATFNRVTVAGAS